MDIPSNQGGLCAHCPAAGAWEGVCLYPLDLVGALPPSQTHTLEDSMKSREFGAGQPADGQVSTQEEQLGAWELLRKCDHSERSHFRQSSSFWRGRESRVLSGGPGDVVSGSSKHTHTHCT